MSMQQQHSACAHLAQLEPGEFQHKRHRFTFPTPRGLDEGKEGDKEATTISKQQQQQREEEDESRARGKYARRAQRVVQTPDSDRDPDAWVVQWEKTHPYRKLKPQLEHEEEEEGEGGAAAKKKKEEEDATKTKKEEEEEEKKEEEETKEKEKEKMKEVVVQDGRGKGLIRLTGQHPLNAEPPAGMLVEPGLITPAPLHYVRNHGPVPRLHWDTHRVGVCGMVERPHEFSMEELCGLPTFEIPVTVVCDGNRRKELNTITRSKGFDWGPGAVGTAVWRGVSLAHVIRRCGVKPGARFVCFEGADQLFQGNYGTSIPLAAAMEENNDMMLAFEMNGQRLPPDHGYPVRVVLPGYVGGRMVKWLSKIEISDEESKNWHHYFDNRVMPPGVDYGNVDSGGWWYKPETLLNHLNVNSVITSPGHEEFFRIRHGLTRYTMRGYAYAGGGREVRRVEVTLDGGNTWIQCQRHYAKDHLRHGINSWTWCHWSLELEAWRLLKADEIAVRAVDAQLNTQPSDPTWNLLGMMNNCWYRIRIEVQDEPTIGSTACIFKHPVQPGSLAGGWMIHSRDEPHPPRAPDNDAAMNKRVGRHIPTSEIRKHDKEDDCWVVIDGRVFDMTEYLKDHPGGACPVMLKAGGDASREYHDIHARDADEIKEYYCIGIAVDDQLPPVQVPSSLRGAPRALDPRKWIDITLVRREEISPDTRKFRFELPGAREGVQLGLPVGLHVLLGAYIDDQLIVRPYTPIGPVVADEDPGYVEFVIKIYFSNKSRAFPKGGLMTQHIESLKVGDKLKMKGPAGHVIYHGRGRIAVNAKPMQVKQISMVAGGTGITPMYQLARAICKDPGDTTQVSLLYANRSTQDILLRRELDELARDHPQFQVWYTVDQPPPQGTWRYSVGHVVEHMLRTQLFPACRDALTLLCGPPAMVELALIPGLESLGYTADDLFEF